MYVKSLAFHRLDGIYIERACPERSRGGRSAHCHGLRDVNLKISHIGCVIYPLKQEVKRAYS
ncbi:MAG: hypothetical protein UU67_C0003G0009 [Candidatus Daviesbacteria bacterium GW2011_GWB1_41_5]|uniref:Uncharacterized protein n=1 Tax=Candidatus Daviesbacteria bacterium GW2011_GWB1_41_5 TaxID=1618429 RepID=A0A0G0WQC4_9BACT|nr:MAG: hypothetical protein UU67_C0003G0009 [Candidatus Daviesbacteria bacterium GW2011_GWB1_41_5]